MRAHRRWAVSFLALSLLPIAAWLPGGEVDLEYRARLLDWAYGVALCAGVGALAGVRGFSESVRSMLNSEARTIMAADLSARQFARPKPEPPPDNQT